MPFINFASSPLVWEAHGSPFPASFNFSQLLSKTWDPSYDWRITYQLGGLTFDFKMTVSMDLSHLKSSTRHSLSWGHQKRGFPSKLKGEAQCCNLSSSKAENPWGWWNLHQQLFVETSPPRTSFVWRKKKDPLNVSSGCHQAKWLDVFRI